MKEKQVITTFCNTCGKTIQFTDWDNIPLFCDKCDAVPNEDLPIPYWHSRFNPSLTHLGPGTAFIYGLWLGPCGRGGTDRKIWDPVPWNAYPELIDIFRYRYSTQQMGSSVEITKKILVWEMNRDHLDKSTPGIPKVCWDHPLQTIRGFFANVVPRNYIIGQPGYYLEALSDLFTQNEIPHTLKAGGFSYRLKWNKHAYTKLEQLLE